MTCYAKPKHMKVNMAMFILYHNRFLKIMYYQDREDRFLMTKMLISA